MTNRIKQLRQERKMTQVRLSIELEVSQETVSAYESGKYFPSYQTLLKLSAILDSSIDYMMGLSDVRYPDSSQLKPEEESLLGLYKLLDKQKKECLQTYLRFLINN